MKKIIVILCVCLLLTGCGSATESGEVTKEPNMFVYIQKAGLSYDYDVVYHKDTKVMYVVSHSMYNNGNFTVLVNADGTPMLYEGEAKE